MNVKVKTIHMHMFLIFKQCHVVLAFDYRNSLTFQTDGQIYVVYLFDNES